MDAGEVRVVQLGEGPGFPLEAFEATGVGRQLGGQGFDRDLPIESRVVGEVHHAHAATTKLTHDLI